MFPGSGNALKITIPIDVVFPVFALIASIIIETALVGLTTPVELSTTKGAKKIPAPSVAGSRQKGNTAPPAPGQNKASSSLLQNFTQELVVRGAGSSKL